MFLDQIKSDLIAAQKSRDQVRVDTLRFLLGAIHDLEITKYPPSIGGTLTEEDVISVLKKQVKTHQESIEMFGKAGREDLVNKEQSQLKILQGYLPEQMDDNEVKLQLQRIVAENPGADFGTLMKLAMQELKGKADGAVIAKILKEITKE